MTRPMLLIGLDGATFDILDHFMAEGVMPFLEGFTRSGVRAILRSTVPALTPPAWTSLVTGRGPGAHGIFDFFRKNSPTSLHFGFTTSREVACPPIWSLASAAGLRSTVLNFPLTFPAPDIRGHVVPGGFMPWRQLRLGCHPAGLFDRLRTLARFNPRELALDMTHEAKAIEGCPEEEYEPWIEMHIRRERQWVDIATRLRQEEPAEFTAILFDGVDKLQHLCWRFIDPAYAEGLTTEWERRVREKCRAYFRELDGLIHELVDLVGNEATVVITSDHGFGPQVRTFFVNTWLEREGYLSWRDDAAPAEAGSQSLGLNQLARHVYQLDWSRTKAFVPLPSGNGVHIVRASEETPGGVPPEEYETFRAELRARLLGVTEPESGEPVVARVWNREDVFAGPHLALAPDLTLELTDGGLVSILRSDGVVRRRRVPTGTHRTDGIFIAASPELRTGVRLDPMAIVDVAPMLLHALELPIPAGLDGTFPAGAFDPAALEARPPRRREQASDTRPVAGAVAGELDAEAEQEILERLQALGYVE